MPSISAPSKAVTAAVSLPRSVSWIRGAKAHRMISSSKPRTAPINPFVAGVIRSRSSPSVAAPASPRLFDSSNEASPLPRSAVPSAVLSGAADSAASVRVTVPVVERGVVVGVKVVGVVGVVVWLVVNVEVGVVLGVVE